MRRARLALALSLLFLSSSGAAAQGSPAPDGPAQGSPAPDGPAQGSPAPNGPAQGSPAQGSAGGLGDPSAAPTPVPPPAVRRLVVTVHTRNDQGKVYCAIWRGREGYPTQRAHNDGEARDIDLEHHRGICVFEGLPPGEYAIAVFHDENGNDDLDRNFLGIPSEGTGASNGAHNPFGPPGYDDARFRVTGALEQRMVIQIRY